MSNIEDVYKNLQNKISEAEDKIIRNRLEYAFGQEGFHERLKAFIITSGVSKDKYITDNTVQELKEFLMDVLEVDGTE